MTIGDKTKYFRKIQNITQSKLAELSEIHPVTIRKYETNKMMPQQPQIEKIATALEINTIALTGISNNFIKLETIGDLMAFLMLLYESGIIQVKGTRNPDGSVQKEELTLIFNPILVNFFSLKTLDSTQGLDNVMIHLNQNEILEDFLKWDKASYIYTLSVLRATESDIEMLEELLMYKNGIELELLSSTTQLKDN